MNEEKFITIVAGILVTCVIAVIVAFTTWLILWLFGVL